MESLRNKAGVVVLMNARLAGVAVENAVVRRVKGEDLAIAAREAVEGGAGIVVAAGGDGTVSAVAGALAGTGVAMGVLPMGTLNHFARDLGIPLDLASAAEIIAGGHVRNVDVGEVNGRVFVNNASIGVYPAMVRKRDQMQQRLGHGKWWSMFKAGMSVFRRHPMLHLWIGVGGECVEQRTPFVFVGNNTYEVSLFSPGRRAAVDRGELCLYFARKTGRLGMIRILVRAILGTLRQDRDFEMMCLPEVRIESHRKLVWVGVDGEVVGVATPLEFRSRPAALRVLVPGGVE